MGDHATCTCRHCVRQPLFTNVYMHPDTATDTAIEDPASVIDLGFYFQPSKHGELCPMVAANYGRLRLRARLPLAQERKQSVFEPLYRFIHRTHLIKFVALKIDQFDNQICKTLADI